ncbi:isocitrate lyase/PEP mutase family protein [Rhodobaculum claviforme]|uniref:Carboxyvinyl-carboxyphosphonate phosphorylmutase n=1 Tax=Rhodobaculum claviforme TaxID=1549854 RepID=A0A934TLF3_9RHOB|nr:isocitrate lyase/phosphoenolpyruvate mutase family protein [Rhodobaculum claviforme]MBK5927714.1 carboxyvinyl-carboxyphosphonate phosphorylmutase [Rhodobaculum claviforme]
MTSLRARLAQPGILLAPGVHDALTAALAEQAGFEALYLSGAAVSYTRLGRPDIGLATMSEMADTMALIRDRVALPVIIDADTGHGNALNAQRTMRVYERAGASALQIEDQTYPKRCGHLTDKALIPTPEMAGKIAAMADARASDATLIIARTDAIAVEGFDAALARAERYLEAGADALFIEAPRSGDELARVARHFQGRAALMANMVEGGTTPIRAAGDLEALGYDMVIFPGGIVRALVHTAEAYYASLRAHGSNAPFAGRMHDFAGLNARLGTAEMLATARRFASDGTSDGSGDGSGNGSGNGDGNAR